MAARDKIPLDIKQLNAQTCWKYCAEVLYRYGNKKTAADFTKALGKYSKVKTTLKSAEVDDCYKKLGFTKSPLSKLSLDQLGKAPVIVGYKRSKTDGHLVLVAGYKQNGDLILRDGCFSNPKGICNMGEEVISLKTADKTLLSFYWW